MTQKHKQLLSKHLPEAIIQELRLVSQDLSFEPKRNVLIVDHSYLVRSIDYHFGDGETYVALSYDGDGGTMAFCDRVPKQFLRLFREEKY